MKWETKQQKPRTKISLFALDYVWPWRELSTDLSSLPPVFMRKEDLGDTAPPTHATIAVCGQKSLGILT